MDSYFWGAIDNDLITDVIPSLSVRTMIPTTITTNHLNAATLENCLLKPVKIFSIQFHIASCQPHWSMLHFHCDSSFADGILFVVVNYQITIMSQFMLSLFLFPYTCLRTFHSQAELKKELYGSPRSRGGTG